MKFSIEYNDHFTVITMLDEGCGKTHPSNNSQLLQLLNSIIHIKITAFIKLFFD